MNKKRQWTCPDLIQIALSVKLDLRKGKRKNAWLGLSASCGCGWLKDHRAVLWSCLGTVGGQEQLRVAWPISEPLLDGRCLCGTSSRMIPSKVLIIRETRILHHVLLYIYLLFLLFCSFNWICGNRKSSCSAGMELAGGSQPRERPAMAENGETRCFLAGRIPD